MGTCAVTGTVGDGAVESEIVSGGGTIILTLTGDTWITSGVASGDYGFTDHTLTETSGAAGHILRQVVLPAGTITAIHTWVRDSDSDLREIKFVIYNDSGDHPTTLHTNIGTTWGETGGVATLNELTGLSISITAGTYWIGFIKESAATDMTYASGDVSTAYTYTTGSFASPDADLTGVGTIPARDCCIWVTY